MAHAARCQEPDSFNDTSSQCEINPGNHECKSISHAGNSQIGFFLHLSEEETQCDSEVICPPELPTFGLSVEPSCILISFTHADTVLKLS
jgi:hypothetical protein